MKNEQRYVSGRRKRTELREHVRADAKKLAPRTERDIQRAVAEYRQGYLARFEPLSRALSVSIPPRLAEQLERLARKRNQTKSELVRAALARYVREEKAWSTRWKRLRAYGARKAKEIGIASERQGYDVMYDLRPGRRRRAQAARGR